MANRALRSRLRATTVATVALINLFTLGAGVAVAALLPARLALWDIPRVGTHRLAAAGPVLPGLSASAPLPAGPAWPAPCPGGWPRALWVSGPARWSPTC